MDMECLKIEGRNKTSYYIGNVVRVYRWILDEINAKGTSTAISISWLDELNKVSHRPYSLGFIDDRKDLFAMSEPGYIKEFSMVGIINSVEGSELVMLVRDTLKWGDSVELLSVTPDTDVTVVLNKMMLKDSEEEIKIAHPNQTIRVVLSEPLKPLWQGALVRKRLT
jgi:putative protease